MFIGSREMDFFNDVTREVIKDIDGVTVAYYPIDYARTMVHDLYQESPEKVLSSAIELNARVFWQPTDVKTDEFGHDEIRTIEVYLHVRDLIERGVNVKTGDYLAYGETFYEVTSLIFNDVAFGKPEYRMAYKLTCIQAREDEFMTKVVGPTWEGYSDPDAVKTNWYQQRGFESNREGKTGDVRDLERKGVLEQPLGGPREVSERGSDIAHDSSFYSEPDDEPSS